VRSLGKETYLDGLGVLGALVLLISSFGGSNNNHVETIVFRVLPFGNCLGVWSVNAPRYGRAGRRGCAGPDHDLHFNVGCHKHDAYYYVDNFCIHLHICDLHEYYDHQHIHKLELHFNHVCDKYQHQYIYIRDYDCDNLTDDLYDNDDNYD